MFNNPGRYDGGRAGHRHRGDAESVRADGLRHERAGGRQRGELVGAAEHLRAALHPVVLKRRLQLGHERAFHAGLEVAPMVLVLRVTRPRVGKADAADKAEPAVNDAHPPVRAVVEPVGHPRERGMVVGEAAAGLLHHLHVGIIELGAGADAVEDHAHLQAGAGALAERVAELPAGAVGVKNVSLEVDRLFRLAQRSEHGGENGVAVLEQLDLVSA